MNDKTIIKQEELAKWILDNSKDSLMMTISEPHAKASHLALELCHMELIISRIVNLCNKTVFGKHRHFDFLHGIVAVENIDRNPHFHIIFKKPDNKESDDFNKKLVKVADKLCSENYQFDLTKTYLPYNIKKFLTKPCYSSFVKVTKTHENTGSYLTKSISKYVILTGRDVKLITNDLNLFVDFHNGKKKG